MASGFLDGGREVTPIPSFYSSTNLVFSSPPADVSRPAGASDADRAPPGFVRAQSDSVWVATLSGWGRHQRPSVRNWPTQTHGAEDHSPRRLDGGSGLTFCAPTHDALLLEDALADIETQSRKQAQIMGDDSEIVMGGSSNLPC